MTSVHAARRSVLALAALAAITLLAASCGDAGKLDTSRAEQKIPAQLRARYPGAEVGATACKPGKVKRAAGVTFTCTTSLDGQPLTAAVVEEDTHGNVSFVLDKVVVSLPKTAKDLASKFGNAATENGGKPATPPTATCPGKATRAVDVYGSFGCTLTIDGQKTAYSVVVCDTKPSLLYVAGASVSNPESICGQSSNGTGSPGTTAPAGQLPGD